VKYAALFRGINVGGKNIVPMKELQQLLLDLGLSKVKTYIQSGNAVFEADLDENALRDIIKTGFLNHFGFECNAMIRSIDEIRDLIEQLPISAAEIAVAEASDPQGEHLYVYFLNTAPTTTQLDQIRNVDIGTDILRVGKREVYLLCHQSIRLSKLAARISKAFDSATVRNWKTVIKLYDLLNNK